MKYIPAMTPNPKPEPRDNGEGKLLFTAHMALITGVEFATAKKRIDETWDPKSEKAILWYREAQKIKGRAAAEFG